MVAGTGYNGPATRAAAPTDLAFRTLPIKGKGKEKEKKKRRVKMCLILKKFMRLLLNANSKISFKCYYKHCAFASTL